MRSRLLINIFLLLLAVALGSFLFFDEANKDAIKPLTTISADSIETITIVHNQREIVLQKTDAVWHLRSPIDMPANQFRVRTLLSLLSANSYAQYETGELELQRYGLDQPATTVSFNDSRVEFGMVNPMNNLRYVKTNSSLHLIDDHFYPMLSSQIGTLVAGELLPADATVSKLVLPENTFSRDANGLWQSDAEISSDAIVETVYQWTHKQAFAVHNYMARDALGEVQVYFDHSDAPLNFFITAVEPWLIIARPDVNLEYHFNLEDYDALLRPGAATMPSSADDALRVSPDEFLDAIQSQP